ncbi:hypothetical protein MBLNU459_g7198t1 [Dothideomycetes sp. NU459]
MFPYQIFIGVPVFIFFLALYTVSVGDPYWIWLAFILYSIFRYLRLIVSIYAFITFYGRPVPEKLQFSARDVTVVCSSLWREPDEHMATLKNFLSNNPARLIVVASTRSIKDIQVRFAAAGGDFDKIEIIALEPEKMGKKNQMVSALQVIDTPIVAFADDDVHWPVGFLEMMLACFENPQVGAAGPGQRTHRHDQPNLWNFLAICYLERRNFNTGATNHLDGAVSTLSGRTNIFRTGIIKNDAFYDYFCDMRNHDDDKSLTRWIYDRGWKIDLQFDPRATIVTTNGSTRDKFWGQCMRWARGHWRGNFRVMSTSSYWYTTHLWSLYAIYISQFQTPALLVDGTLVYLLYHAMKQHSPGLRLAVHCAFALWLLFTKIVKIIPHFLRHPRDIQFVPIMVLFSYLHGWINVKALFTMNNTEWYNDVNNADTDAATADDCAPNQGPSLLD